jgi:hypothetical protein
MVVVCVLGACAMEPASESDLLEEGDVSELYAPSEGLAATLDEVAEPYGGAIEEATGLDAADLGGPTDLACASACDAVKVVCERSRPSGECEVEHTQCMEQCRTR